MIRRLSPSTLRAQDGFTMIIAIGVMLVTSLLLVAAFTIANGDVQNSYTSTAQKQAYYSALAGVQQYEYLLQANPDYWQTCAKVESSAETKSNPLAESGGRYVVTPLPASTAPKGTTACSTENPFSTMIESTGTLANTFRIKSTGYAGGSTKSTGASRSIIATFRVAGFLDYVYYTNFETEDPGLYETESTAAKELANECRGKYYSEWSVAKNKPACPAINFISGDAVEGPMHTNDTALVSGAATFGRSGHVPKDVVELNGGTYGSAAGCKSSAIYNTATGCYTTTGPTLTPPPNDTSLSAYVEPEYEYSGMTRIELKGTEMNVTTYSESNGAEIKKTGVKLPANGLIYVQPNNKGCGWSFSSESSNTDASGEETGAKGCGDVYVSGNYSSSLTIAGQNNVIVNGNIYPTSVAGKLGSTPSGTAVLGLIAGEYVRLYHPCSGGINGSGSLSNPYIYAAILATSHSWIVDNPRCGKSLGELNVYGAIGQNYRGIVGTSGGSGGSTGYLKGYEYDDRLATDEPPYFLAPLKAGWKIVRETAPAPG
jgi:Tfp pilus assembly protein PilX